MLRLPALVVDKMQGWVGSKQRSCTVRLEQENGCGGLSGGGDSLLLKGAAARKLGGGSLVRSRHVEKQGYNR
jgi:hypothetical protein